MTIAILALVFIGAGCGGNGDKSSSPLPANTTETIEVPAIVETIETSTTPETCKTDDQCFTYDGMQQALQRAVGFVEPFIDQSYAQPHRVAGIVFVSSGTNADSPCGVENSEVLAYCPGDNIIYMGQDSMWDVYDSEKGGDSGLATILAHEYGHHIQTVAGVPDPQTSRETIPHENQADCIAGAWVGWAAEQGYFVAGEDKEIVATLENSASSEGADREHGTFDERQEAVTLGLVNGLSYCNDYFASTPIITQG